MKNIFIKIVLLIGIYCSCCPCFGQFSTKVNLQPIDKVRYNGLNNFEVIFSTDTVQKKSEKGLRYCITIKNDSTSNMVIKNPLDHLAISLSNQWSQEVLVRTIPKALSYSYSKGKIFVNNTYVIEKATINGTKIKKDVINMDTVSIPAKGTFEVVFNIRNVVDPEWEKPYPADKWMPIGLGKYTFILLVSIHEAGATKPGAKFILSGLVRNKVSVRYID